MVGAFTLLFARSDKFQPANAVIAYGASWSFFPSTYRITRDGQEFQIRSGNSSLPDSSPSHSFLGAIMAFEPNPSGALSTLSIDNAEGVGHMGIDYIELITVSGGMP